MVNVSNRAAARLLSALVLVLFASAASATIFIVPDDAELVAKSGAIVTGVVISANALEVEPGYVETQYEIALDRVFKGPMKAKTTMRISSPGGSTGKFATIVHSAAHFIVGDQVLLFLTPHRGGWTPTDLTLGKFRFAQTSRGYGVVVRDAEDIVGWDRDGKVHREKIRLEAEFLQFIQEAVAGRAPKNNIGATYEVEASDVLAPASPETITPRRVKTEALSPSNTYSVRVWACDGSSFPARWTTAQMTSGVNFFKNSAQNASSLGDGGVSTIQNALAAWTNDCNSAVKIQYGGTTANLRNGGDGVNTIVFNDPGNHVGGTWSGSGTIAICFSSAGDVETFDGMTWANFSDSDVVFQDGFPGNHAAMNTAMTHEIGHGIGFRHADQDFNQSCSIQPGCVLQCNAAGPCNANTQECANTAIMTATANSALGFTLQAWDQNAAAAIYPGGSCVVLVPPTNVLATATSGTGIQVTWTAATGAASYNVYRSTNGTTYSLAGNTVGTTFNDTVATGQAALYKVRSVNGTESSDSNIDLATAIVFTDPTLTIGVTEAKAVHITELRSAVNAVRALVTGLGSFSFTDPVLNSTVEAKSTHLTELRSALNAARSGLSLSAISYTDPTITALSTLVKKAHIDDLRNGVK